MPRCVMRVNGPLRRAEGLAHRGAAQPGPSGPVWTGSCIAGAAVCQCRVMGWDPLQAADIWSCGVILYVMVVGTYPFCLDDLASYKKLAKAEYHTPKHLQVCTAGLLPAHHACTAGINVLGVLLLAEGFKHMCTCGTARFAQ